MKSKKEPLYAINLIRLFCSIAILLFHMYWGGANFYELNFIFRQSVVFLTIFFMLSGFVLRYNYRDVNLIKFENMKTFIKKRFVSIFPYYILILFVYILTEKNFNLVNTIVVMPFQFLMLHEYEHYDFISNGGTWFFSCIFVCYLLYPYVNYILSKISKKSRYILSAIVCVLTISAGLTSLKYGITIYTNLMVRFLEFVLGCILIDIINDNKSIIKKVESNLIFKKIWIIVSVGCLLSVYVLEKYSNRVYSHQGFLMPITCFFGILLLFTFSTSKDKLLNRISNSKIVSFFSNYSFEIWCATFFCSKIIQNDYIVKILSGDHYNLRLVLLWFVLNALFCCILKKYNYYIRKVFEKYSLKRISIMTIILFLVLFILKFFVKFGL